MFLKVTISDEPIKVLSCVSCAFVESPKVLLSFLLSDYVFCQLHRLPEQHNCIFNHKEKGRQDARDKMVSPKKHIGTSLKRIDSDS